MYFSVFFVTIFHFIAFSSSWEEEGSFRVFPLQTPGDMRIGTVDRLISLPLSRECDIYLTYNCRVAAAVYPVKMLRVHWVKLRRLFGAESWSSLC